MKYSIALLSALLFFSCKQEPKDNTNPEVKDTIQTETTIHKTTVIHDTISEESNTVRKFSNERFRKVLVTKTGDGQYRVEGEAQIFEASFSWVVEDGHDQLQDGFATTDAGAPEWGKFRFAVDLKKTNANATLTLILFESSAKDGSRQYELSIPLRD